MVLQVFLLLFFVFMLAPILIVVVVSFTSANYVAFPIEGFSLRWFRRIYEYRPFLRAIIVSFEVGILSTAVACILGIPAALALVRSRSRLADAVMTFLLSPLSMPMIVLGLALLFYLSAIGLGISFTSLLIGHTVIGLPYIIRTVAGVYRGLSREYEETAATLGAGRATIFWRITLPQIRPGIFSGALFAMLISLDNLPISYFFASAHTNTLPVIMLSYMEYQFDPSIAALSTVQLSVAVIALFVVERIYGLKFIGTPG
jgi:putative spermidine/putrescine transport system permease protein